MTEPRQAHPTIEWNRRLGAHIEASRLRAGLTRAQLGARMGVSEETIRRWERAGSTPSEDRLARLIAVLALDDASFVSLAQQPVEPRDELPLLARRLRDERRDRRITQAEAAQLLDVAQPTYAGWEVGRATPDGANLARVADFLGTSVAAVADLVDAPFTVDYAGWPALGRILGRQRQRLRLTRSELAQRVGVTKTTIANWELGYRTPRVQQLRLLATALSASVMELEAALPVDTGALSTLGALIRNRQTHLGLSRAEIARRAGTDEATLSRWVNGHRRPDERGLRRLADVLGVAWPVMAAAAAAPA